MHFTPAEVHKFEPHFFDDTREAEKIREKMVKELSAANGVIFIDNVLQQQAITALALRTPSCVAPSGVNLEHFAHCIPPSSPDVITIGYFGKVVAE